MRSEQRRLADIAAGRGDWQRWGTYVSDRAWGTVREDYSADGNAWDYGFYFDVIRHDNERVPLKIYSMVGLVPLFVAAVVEPSTLAKLPVVMQTVGNVLNRREFLKSILPTFVEPGVDGTRLLAVVNRTRLAAILQRVLDEAHWRDYVPFHECFHGDTGAGLGAGHQTGWTALVALLLQYGGRLQFETVRTEQAAPSAVQKGKVA